MRKTAKPVTPDELNFKDHFSGHASDYARFRPEYPARLFEWLAAQAPARDSAWDCACGTGQASRELARRFTRVVATDASVQQIAAAGAAPPNLEFRVAPAEDSGIEPATVDLICVAQALHWLDAERFYAEARRVARPRALLAVWMYGSLRVDGVPDNIPEGFEHDRMGPHWPAERAWIDDGYARVQLPGEPVEVPQFAMTARWTLGALLGYVGSWSAVRRHRQREGIDPVPELAAALAAHWGAPDVPRTVRWPLVVRAARL